MCIDAGMDSYISKPIDFKNTLQVIGNILNKSVMFAGATE
jgi:CheY-like chemotaxis protein